jgi:hypothetical protein
MKTRIRSKKFLAMAIALAALAATWAMWGARPAKAVVTFNSRTGPITATQNVGFRVLATNTGGVLAIIDDGKIVDFDGHTVMLIAKQTLEPGQGAYLADFVPSLAADQRLPVRVEVRSEIGDSRKITESSVHIRLEAYDTLTGKTFIIDDGKSIIDDGK